MKGLLLVAGLLGATATYAQTAPVTEAVATYRYCALIVSDRYFNAPDRPYLDYGQAAPGAVADPEMAEMATNISQSRSIIDMLNYLGRHRWELLTVTPVPLETRTSSTGSQNIGNALSLSSYASYETRYVFRRRMP